MTQLDLSRVLKRTVLTVGNERTLKGGTSFLLTAAAAAAGSWTLNAPFCIAPLFFRAWQKIANINSREYNSNYIMFKANFKEICRDINQI